MCLKHSWDLTSLEDEEVIKPLCADRETLPMKTKESIFYNILGQLRLFFCPSGAKSNIEF